MSKIQNLSTATQEPLHTRDIDECSITPTTLLRREFPTPPAASIATITAATARVIPAKDAYFIEHYQFVPSTGSTAATHTPTASPVILRFGINPYATENIALIAAALAALTPPPPTTGSGASTTPPAASSTGGSPPSRTAGRVDPKVTIPEWATVDYRTDIEKFLFESAKNHLVANTSDVAVVVDIFARNPNKSIKTESKDDTRVTTTPIPKINVPEIHSVVLYKQDHAGVLKYLVIDPSNSTFSYILTAAPDAVLCFAPDPVRIYKAAGTTGPTSWRDCVDIAVKLGFAFSKNKETIPLSEVNLANGAKVLVIDPKFAESSLSVKDITNHPGTYLPKIVSELPVRSSQSSDIIQAKFVKFLLQKFKSVFEKTLTHFATDGPEHYHVKGRVMQNTIQKTLYLVLRMRIAYLHLVFYAET